MKNQQEKYNLPQGWIWTTIDEIGIVVSGGTPSTKNKEFWGGNIAWITPADLSEHNGKYIIKGSRNITQIGLDYSSAKLIPKGSVLFSSRAPIGYVVVAQNDLSTSQGFKNLIPMTQVDSEYIYYYFLTLKSQAEKVASGTTFLELSAKSFSKLPFPLCSLKEQRLIVSQIDLLFSKLNEAENSLQKANKGLKIYKQALLNQAFSGKLTEKWRRENSIKVSAKQLIDDIEKERQLKYDLEILEWEKSLKKWKKDKEGQRPSKPSKPTVPEKPTDEQINRKWNLPKEWQWTQLGLISFVTKLAGFEYTEYVKYTEKGDLPVIKAENVGQDGFKKTTYSKVIAESVEHLKRSKLEGGELIIVFVGSVGNVATIPQNQSFFLGPNIALARPYNEINTKFLEYFYQSHKGKKLLLATAKAVAQPSLSMGNIRQTPVAITSKEEQFKIVQIIENQFTLTNNLEKTVDNVLNEITALRHSILKKAFEGRLVNYTSDESVENLLNNIQEERRLYIENQKVLNLSKPKQKKKMEEKKSILDILKESTSPISAQELWEKSTSEGDIERFYSEIKEIYHQIDELKSKTESLLTLKDENK
ncbi:hypothetical protein EGI16_12930 [Chryseobacterium sp. G0240]|uniref:restriction endonuclease subunit S n=1 Tax=Chryseobacterium sp. G0240 TaxID=2487066 RepID=UPI000F44FB47|nr:restriction endonuclease subunit S [Chryseobacterium sp. G0240]ROI02537.1 hypothetical protein EGI16_12930 [Chryseobacterium sp. G0240]